MAYSKDTVVYAGNAGMSLGAQLIADTGTHVTSILTTGFLELGNGYYIWHYAAIPDTFAGGIAFYDMNDTSTIIAVEEINPQINNGEQVVINVGHSQTPAIATGALQTEGRGLVVQPGVTGGHNNGFASRAGSVPADQSGPVVETGGSNQQSHGVVIQTGVREG